jgi:branched-chain amino acid transport system substrate-binding protein
MRRRTILQIAAATVLASGLGFGPADAQETLKIGVVGPKTGALAPGAATSHWPNFRLWAHLVNQRGGLKLKDGQRKIELIEYDDRTQPGEAIKAVERLINHDKADLIMGLYGTGFNLAAAPIFDKHGYPQFAVAALTDKVPELTERYKGLFFFGGHTSAFVHSLVDVLKGLRDQGKINNRLAMVNVADTFGIELANAGRDAFKTAGFEIVYDKSYPLGTQDLAPVIKAAKNANPDSFVAWSYPPDTFGLADQAKIEDLGVKAYYSAVATSFPGFQEKFGNSAQHILGGGGIVRSPAMEKYLKDHLEVTNVKADFWASPNYYSSLQVLEQAIEGVGSLDRQAIIEYVKTHTFDTVHGEMDVRKQTRATFWTVGQWQNGQFTAVYGHGVGNVAGTEVKLKTGW